MSGREREPAPERIWIDRGPRGGWMHRDDQKMPDSEHEYVRADLMKAALTAAGYRIIGTGEVDPVTVERCAEIARAAHISHAPGLDGYNIDIATALRSLTEAKP